MTKNNLILSVVALTTLLFSTLGYAQTVTIGKQVWSTTNLDVTSFRNGDAIPHAKTEEEWKKAGENRQPAWCYYNNDSANGIKYGKLYNWYAVNDARRIAPKDWHIPSDKEWTALTNYLGGEVGSGRKMKSTSGWTYGSTSMIYDAPNNSSGFSGLPGGYRSSYGWNFYEAGAKGYWWCSNENGKKYAWTRFLNWSISSVVRGHNSKMSGYSVRCLRD